MILRPYLSRDTDGIIALIDDIYREYGFQICLENAESDLLDIPRYFPHDSFMVLADEENSIRGTVALAKDAARPHVCWLKRLYLDKTLRGGTHARDLMKWSYDKARTWNMDRMELWSDTEFARAHTFYEAEGFQRDGRVRDMDDGHIPYSEYFFFKELS
ncbi:MAG: hypothetical protein COA73_15455 [Candidatus Hydrogenedentota bacterium]|nr:MAG: hypothetical protein COA73_15455 [Candidatus Hydrogenedentota bacterium]